MNKAHELFDEEKSCGLEGMNMVQRLYHQNMTTHCVVWYNEWVLENLTLSWYATSRMAKPQLSFLSI